MDGPREESVPEKMRPIYEEIVAITDAFAREHLDEEYAQLCRKLAAALARKRPSPLVTGRRDVWACGIVYAIGQVNFLFDRTQTPHMSASELCALFGVNKSTCGGKARTINNLLNIGPFDPEWYRPSQLGDNPLAWMIMVNGLVIDARHAPRHVQEEAFRRGLIPYLPGTGKAE